MPLVLVENERTMGGLYDSWQDLTGVCYHYPNKYRNLVQPGERFVYYRGVRKEKGGRRQHPEYFGCGLVRDIWPDLSVPEQSRKDQRKYYCGIAQFTSFDRPVSWMAAGEKLEPIPQNMFRDGVRRISDTIFDEILARAQVSPAPSSGPTRALSPAPADEERIREYLEKGGGNTPPRRLVSSISRIIRDTRLTREMKDLYASTCQICREPLSLPNGERYSEAHHIRPLGQPHYGPDSAQNIIVVCPNHHALCDLGAIVLDPAVLHIHPLHQLGLEYIKYHNEVVVARHPLSASIETDPHLPRTHLLAHDVSLSERRSFIDVAQ